jgi:hypothetical protein
VAEGGPVSELELEPPAAAEDEMAGEQGERPSEDDDVAVGVRQRGRKPLQQVGRRPQPGARAPRWYGSPSTSLMATTESQSNAARSLGRGRTTLPSGLGQAALDEDMSVFSSSRSVWSEPIAR